MAIQIWQDEAPEYWDVDTETECIAVLDLSLYLDGDEVEECHPVGIKIRGTVTSNRYHLGRNGYLVYDVEPMTGDAEMDKALGLIFERLGVKNATAVYMAGKKEAGNV